MVYIQNNAVNQIWLGINEWATLSNPTYLFQLENSQGRDSVYFIPRNITANYPDSYANKYLVFEFETFLGNPIQLRATGATDCNIHLINENQYWLYIWEQPQGDGNLNPLNATNKVFNELAFIFVDENNTYYTGNTANFADNVIYYSQGTTPPPSPSPSSTLPAPSTSPTPTPSITPTITPTLTNTPTITPTETLTPTPTPSSDLRFQLGDGFNAPVQNITQDSQGDYIMTGEFNFYKGLGSPRVMNMLPNGGLLGGLSSGFLLEFGALTFNKTILNPDPNISDAYIGMFNSSNLFYSGQTIGSMLHINYETGELIQNGISNLITTPNVNSLTFSGGTLFGVGNFTSVSGTSQNRIFAISETGVLDTTFRTNIGTGFNNQILDIAQTIDGRLICVGNAVSFNGNTRNGIFRLNTDGTFDSTFSSGTGFSAVAVNRIVVLSDGRMVVGGNFTSYNGTARQRICILNSNGTLDTSFNAGAIFTGAVVDLTADETNGWIYVLSQTPNIGGNANIDYLCRLDFTGVLDTSFPASQIGWSGFPTSGPKNRIFLTTTGKILIGANFTFFGNQQYNNLIQLNQDGTSDTRTDI